MENQGLPTYFAPPERAPFYRVQAERLEIETISEIRHVLEAIPSIAAVLNQERQIVYSNKALFDLIDINSLDEVLGMRLGEAVNCIHSNDQLGGCGTSEACRFCGAAQAIVHCQTHDEAVTKECRISATQNGSPLSYDLMVTSSPFQFRNSRYTILTLKDIGDEKRRRALEQIFFHDIINHAQSVSGLLVCAQEIVDPEEIQQLLDLARTASMEMIDGILSQRDLVAAENGEIRMMKRLLSTRMVLNECIGMIKHHFVASDRQLKLDDASVDMTVETDETLVKRILMNMLKNALEATPEGGTVTAGCEVTPKGATFWSHNPTFIPRPIQLQMFQRSYSTKGANRGLGTYSMKLLGEHYLGGEISFTTSEESGTKFFLTLPVASATES
ncbi:MAG TPA: PAS domain-containing sensor histidine kinase [Bacteroidota bacterium]|nr:PAS domain-containing sensor histidine kinase [Bacteroidota bacterium]